LRRTIFLEAANRLVQVMDACSAEAWRDAVQTLLEPGVVLRSDGFASPDFAWVTQGLLVPRCALG
jgi:hypothetical protein